MIFSWCGGNLINILLLLLTPHRSVLSVKHKMSLLHLLVLLHVSLSTCLSTYDRWDASIAVLEQGVRDRVFPGAVALVATQHGVLLRVAVGNLTYDGVPTPTGHTRQATTVETIFDMASCSKVTATTTAVALLFGSNATLLDTNISEFLPGYEKGGKGPITVRNCLLHNAGLPPDPTPYDYWDPAYGCDGAPLPSTMNFGCSNKIYTSLLQQKLSPNATVGAKYVYSDLSFITLMYVVGTVALERGEITPTDFLPACTNALADAAAASSSSSSSIHDSGLSKQCAFEAFVRLKVFGALRMMNTGYLPKKEKWSQCQPTWVPDGEPGMHGHALQGQVEDGNAYILGGIAGHAGVFSTADDLALLMNMWMKFVSCHPPTTGCLLDDATIDLFIKINNASQSSRALGWNTNDMHAQPDGGWNLSCGNLSKATFTHVGFTGTQLCGDPVTGAFTVLLTARVYGAKNTGNSTGIHAVRKDFNSEVANVLKELDGLDN